MPPTLFAALSIPFTRLAYMLFPTGYANGIISGAYTFCESVTLCLHVYSLLTLSFVDILYDLMHYSLHHSKLPAYLREMKKYHLAHHYQNFELGFGVTSKLWDLAWGTELIYPGMETSSQKSAMA